MTHIYIEIQKPFAQRALIQEASQKFIANIEMIDTTEPFDIDPQTAKGMEAKETVTYSLDIKANTRADAEEIAKAIVQEVDTLLQLGREELHWQQALEVNHGDYCYGVSSPNVGAMITHEDDGTYTVTRGDLEYRVDLIYEQIAMTLSKLSLSEEGWSYE